MRRFGRNLQSNQLCEHTRIFVRLSALSHLSITLRVEIDGNKTSIYREANKER
jgi:hypothetical protein